MSIGDKLARQVFHLKDVWDTLIVVLNVKETLCFCVIYMHISQEYGNIKM